MNFRFIFSSLLYGLFVFFLSCSSKNEKQQPNILFIMSDDHAYQAISAYNDKLIHTPNIDKIAEQGIIYNKAFVTNSICAPSRAVILTGKYSHLNGVKGNSEVFDGSQQTVPKLLQKNGYQTAIVGKWHLKSHPTGFDYWNVLPGQGDYYNPDFIKQGKDTVYQGYVTELITKLSLDWLKKRKKDQPFFLMMHHKAPHRSWMPAIKNLALFDDKDFPLPDNFYDSYEGREALKTQKLTVKDHMDIRMDFKVPCNDCDTSDINFWAPGEYWRRLDRLTPEERKQWEESYKKEETEFLEVKDDETKYDQWKFRRYMEDYLRCIASVDESVGEVLQFLNETGLDENTVVIYTSDQGFYLGEHGLFDKRFMYEEALRTPLMIKYPKEIDKGASSGLLVQNLDIAPTILDLAQLEKPGGMQGKSLRETWKSDSVKWRDAIYYHFYEKGWGVPMHYGIRTDRYKLIHYYGEVDHWELYDLQNDPAEMNNLYGNVDYKEIQQELHIRLKELQQKYKDSVPD
ncbi:sulfatase [Prolixibacteraceae bacterium Z1-6]|uniref:Sulfatase n=1 Tax=Draconibacterium aestuarii TaxID=2998507 RepID=A0A9X3J7G6_9BACT|nr:sulfatase [Prolixibacteraceae bacterium Z1-6]